MSFFRVIYIYYCHALALTQAVKLTYKKTYVKYAAIFHELLLFFFLIMFVVGILVVEVSIPFALNHWCVYLLSCLLAYVLLLFLFVRCEPSIEIITSK